MERYRKPGKPGRIATAIIYFLSVADVARILASPELERAGWYVALLAPLFFLLTVTLSHPDLPRIVLHSYLGLQAALVVAVLALDPTIDTVTSLMVILAYQAAHLFDGRARRMWVGAFALLAPASLMLFQDPMRGLALGLVPMAFAIVLAAFVAANEELEVARSESQALLADIQETNRQLQVYAGQVQELAALEERNRLARELHDSISQTLFSIILNTRATQILLKRDPKRVRPQLEQLQTLTQDTLAEMRGLIERLRPRSESN